MKEIKTVLFLIYHRQQVRNILRNDAFNAFANRPNLRIVILTAKHRVALFQKEFGRENVLVEGIEDIPEPFSFLDRFFRHLSFFYVDTKLVRHNRKRFILAAGGSRFHFFYAMTGITIVGNLQPLRFFLKFLDRQLIRRKDYHQCFDKYCPNLVFLPHVSSRFDRAFIRTARSYGVPSVGMINSWDTIGFAKYPIRGLSDFLLVHNEIIKEEAMTYLDAKPSRVIPVGMPHFDHYVNHPRSSRESFFKKIGLDPNKRLLLFAPFFDTAWQVVSILQDAIVSGELPRDVQILVRQHPTKDMEAGDLKLTPGISVMEKPVTYHEEGEVSYSEIMKEDMEHLADSLYHSDVTFNVASTMSIDAAAFDKPIINVAFDGWEERPFYQSVKQFYEESRVHYVPVMQSGGVRIAHNRDEMITYTKMYLGDPRMDQAGRKKIVEEQCWKLDGKAGQRIFDFLLRSVNLKTHVA